MHLLVAEDNTVNQKLFARILHASGCTISFVWNGQQALDYLTSSPATHPRPDIIFMDQAMPVMGGHEATSIIRTQPPFSTDTVISSTPIIGMTASSTRDEYERLRDKGFDDVLHKPLRKAELHRIIAYWARRRVQPRNGVLPVPATGNMVPIPGRMQWGPVPWVGVKGPRSLL